MKITKRQFLRAGAGLSMTGGLLRSASPLVTSLAALAGLASESARASGSDYRALVCLFMSGGNDAHNWIVPTNNEEFIEYTSARSSLALPASALRGLSAAPRQASGRGFAMASDLDPLRALYEQGEMAVVANVGPLLQPTSKADFDAGRNLPPKLFSHNDQQASWQAMAPEGARSGWGGRVGDLLMSLNDKPLFTTVSASGNSVFLAGLESNQYKINASGPVGIGGLRSGYTLGSNQVAAALRKSIADNGSNAFQSAISRVTQRSDEAYRVLAEAVANVNIDPAPANPVMLSNGQALVVRELDLAKQLRAVAQMVAAHQTLGLKRQVFMVSMGGFDTHSGQLGAQPALMASVAHSVRYFADAMRQLGLGQQVTLFTASDFGRTLTSNGSGSDHGWGSHHFVSGGAVRGRNIYGRFPTLALGGPDDVGSGRLLPSTPVTQYAATLAKWMGVPASGLAGFLPGLNEFLAAGLDFV